MCGPCWLGEPSLSVTFDLKHAPWQRPSSPVQSVNDPAVSVWKFVDCMEVDLLHPPRKWVVWWTLRCAFGVDQAGLPVIGQSFLENAVVGVFWPLPSGPASSPMKCILPTMKVFHVVYNAPPPISLVLHLNMNDYHRVLMALTAKTEISWKSNHFRTSKWSHFTLSLSQNMEPEGATQSILSQT